MLPMHYFNGVSFVNVNYNALINIFDPPQAWANLDDCCEWPCTAPSNIVYTFSNAVFSVTDSTTALPPFWTVGTTSSYSFQIVSNFASAVGTYPNCSKITTWNAWICADPTQTAVPQVGTLLFESLDYDTEDRSVQPVIITNSDSYRNVLNSFMDHTWDGFYTGQKRLSRFPSQILTGKSYTVTYTGTPFKNGRYTLQADPAAKGILIKVPYPNAGAYSVKVNDVIVQPQSWDSVTQKPAAINVATAKCGANLFVGVENYLQFFLTPGCTVIVIPRDAILTSVRLQWTAAEFFAGDGATTFTQRMASVLGVDITRVKIVSVFEGSLNVGIQILDDTTKNIVKPDGTVTTSVATVTEMTALKAKLVEKLTTATPTTLGAPILEVQAVQLSQYVAPTSSSPTSATTSSTTTSSSVSDSVSVANIMTPGGSLMNVAVSMSAFGFVLFTALF